MNNSSARPWQVPLETGVGIAKASKCCVRAFLIDVESWLDAREAI